DEFLDCGETVHERAVFANLAVAEAHEVGEPAGDHAPGGVQPSRQPVQSGGAIVINHENIRDIGRYVDHRRDQALEYLHHGRFAAARPAETEHFDRAHAHPVDVVAQVGGDAGAVPRGERLIKPFGQEAVTVAHRAGSVRSHYRQLC